MDEQHFSYWEQKTFFDTYDVIIIGSGIVGLNAALQLKTAHSNLKIAVLERGVLPSGASTKNAGFACFGSVSELLSEIKTYGEEVVLNIVEKRWRGLQTLRKNLGDKAICFEANGGYELFLNEDKKSMEACFSAVYKLNILLKPMISSTDIFSVRNEKITDFGFDKVKGMIFNNCEGQIDTGKMMKALLIKVQSLGVMIFNQCEVFSFEGDDSKSIRTSFGMFKSKNLILATNAFTSKLIPEIDIKPARGQVLVTEPIPNLKVKGTFHYQEGFYYFRNIDGRILLGGGRNLAFKEEETSEMVTTEIIQSSLEKLLKEIVLPKQKVKIDYRWSGIMGFGNELEPIVKKINTGIYIAARCNGMGVAIGSLTGMEVAELVLKEL